MRGAVPASCRNERLLRPRSDSFGMPPAELVTLASASSSVCTGRRSGCISEQARRRFPAYPASCRHGCTPTPPFPITTKSVRRCRIGHVAGHLAPGTTCNIGVTQHRSLSICGQMRGTVDAGSSPDLPGSRHQAGGVRWRDRRRLGPAVEVRQNRGNARCQGWFPSVLARCAR
jgi:hypothetical protein